jgi:hypothetical protein
MYLGFHSSQPGTAIVPTTLHLERMPPNGAFDLWYSCPHIGQAVRLRGSGETDEDFRHRSRSRQEENRLNDRLNIKSKEVGEALDERLWASMYLKYLVERVNYAGTVYTHFPDLPDIAHLSIQDSESYAAASVDPSTQPHFKVSTECHIEVLEQRRRDAQIGTEIAWSALDSLTHALTSGMVALL